MKVEFLRKFSKDLDEVRPKSTKESVIRIIELMEVVDSLEKTPNIKTKGSQKCVQSQNGRLQIRILL